MFRDMSLGHGSALPRDEFPIWQVDKGFGIETEVSAEFLDMAAVEFAFLSNEFRNRRYRYARCARNFCLRHILALDRHCEILIGRQWFARMCFTLVFFDEIAENLQVDLLWSGKT